MNTIFREVDGQNFEQVYKTVKDLRKEMLKSQKVGIIRSKVLRYYAHSGTKIDLEDTYRKNDNKKLQKDVLKF